MEPLVALSLATSVAQFIDFGSKLIRGTKEITEAGSTVSVVHLSNITSDLIGINSSLEEQLLAKSPGHGALSKEELVSLPDTVNE
jgi:hypothetical protein